MGQIVGIDLGTTNSVVGVIEAGRPIVIANSEGTRTTPSIVGFTKSSEIVIGDQARRQLVLNPKNTFYNLKRFIGRDWDELDETSISVPYNVKSNENGSVRILSPFTEREYAPEELISSIIRKLINDAETYLGDTIDSAVITVPAYFNDSQRQATKDSAVLAGIRVDRILNEPTAAALAYGFEKSSSNNVLVFDLGGGTFDVSLLRISNGVFDVKATCGDTQLGGNDFDSKIVDWLAEGFLEKYKIDLRRDRQALQRLTEAAEKAKCELSGLQKTKISLPFITTGDDGPLHIEEELNRKLFESLSEDLLDRLLEPVQIALDDSGWDANEIDEVVLVGGSTRIPKVQSLLSEFFNGKEPCRTINQDEAVAYVDQQVATNAGIWNGFSYSKPNYERDVGRLIDALQLDTKYGGNASVTKRSTAYWVGTTSTLAGPPNEQQQFSAMIDYVKILVRDYILTNTAFTSLQSVTTQSIDSTTAEAGTATSIAALMTNHSTVILNGLAQLDPLNDPRYGYHYLTDPTNPSSTAKNNTEMDVFLMNDANRIMNVSIQGHGGFAQVLDSEGQILIKLIHRQTGEIAFDLIKELQSGWRAFWYNNTAKLFKMSLKTPFDPETSEEDYLIEDILQRQFQSGTLEPQAAYKFFDLYLFV